MKTITIRISDLDYDDMLHHFTHDRPGAPLVAVVGVIKGPKGQSLSELQAQARADIQAKAETTR